MAFTHFVHVCTFFCTIRKKKKTFNFSRSSELKRGKKILFRLFFLKFHKCEISTRTFPIRVCARSVIAFVLNVRKKSRQNKVNINKNIFISIPCWRRKKCFRWQNNWIARQRFASYIHTHTLQFSLSPFPCFFFHRRKSVDIVATALFWLCEQ